MKIYYLIATFLIGYIVNACRSSATIDLVLNMFRVIDKFISIFKSSNSKNIVSSFYINNIFRVQSVVYESNTSREVECFVRTIRTNNIIEVFGLKEEEKDNFENEEEIKNEEIKDKENDEEIKKSSHEELFEYDNIEDDEDEKLTGVGEKSTDEDENIENIELIFNSKKNEIFPYLDENKNLNNNAPNSNASASVQCVDNRINIGLINKNSLFSYYFGLDITASEMNYSQFKVVITKKYSHSQSSFYYVNSDITLYEFFQNNPHLLIESEEHKFHIKNGIQEPEIDSDKQE